MNLVQYILILLVRMYQVTLSPVIPFVFGASAACRFEPTCSRYAMEAVKTHGAFRGSWLAAKRVCRCHPWGGCGEDPVPPVKFQVPSSKFQGRAKESNVQCPMSNVERVERKFQAPSVFAQGYDATRSSKLQIGGAESKVQGPKSKVVSAPVLATLRRGKEVRI
jgi:putative membrane protein insertion efficiency factor